MPIELQHSASSASDCTRGCVGPSIPTQEASQSMVPRSISNDQGRQGVHDASGEVRSIMKNGNAAVGSTQILFHKRSTPFNSRNEPKSLNSVRTAYEASPEQNFAEIKYIHEVLKTRISNGSFDAHLSLLSAYEAKDIDSWRHTKADQDLLRRLKHNNINPSIIRDAIWLRVWLISQGCISSYMRQRGDFEHVHDLSPRLCNFYCQENPLSHPQEEQPPAMNPSAETFLPIGMGDSFPTEQSSSSSTPIDQNLKTVSAPGGTLNNQQYTSLQTDHRPQSTLGHSYPPHRPRRQIKPIRPEDLPEGFRTLKIGGKEHVLGTPLTPPSADN